jgi:hypothetical protein
MAATQPEVVAHHYTEAGLPAEAIAHWRRAGERALGRSANVEAGRHLSRALELLDGLDDDAERAGRDNEELAIQSALTAALMASEGYSSPWSYRLCLVRGSSLRPLGMKPNLSTRSLGCRWRRWSVVTLWKRTRTDAS